VKENMQALIAIVIVIYLIGVGVVLAPTVHANWNNGTAADFAASVGHELPYALVWPAEVYRGRNGRG
jgi:hypothetical protein